MPGPGRRYKYKDLIFWAENGLIRMEDQRTGEFFTITRQEAFERAKAIAEEINMITWGDEREATLSLVQSMCDVIDEAKNQGDPTDPEVIERVARETKRSKKARILLPGGTVPGAEMRPLSSFYNPGGNGKKH